MAILESTNLSKSFGSLKAVIDLSFGVKEKEILAIVGPNGSGKTTLFNVISKVLRPNQGTVVFDGHRIDKLPPHRITHLGLARTFQVPSFLSGVRRIGRQSQVSDRPTRHIRQEETHDCFRFGGQAKTCDARRTSSWAQQPGSRRGARYDYEDKGAGGNCHDYRTQHKGHLRLGRQGHSDAQRRENCRRLASGGFEGRPGDKGLPRRGILLGD
ncbi:MAG: ATP-binding cassette domain-containing protein [Thaumarchaeota archaeon]|nr:MAG: ATP-binding cassette domain-containing protein [Nitrososphaerota archaeon]